MDLPNRIPDYPIDPIFLERWSPRAFTGEALPERDLLTMFEAARWAASSYNSQPWRFLYALRDSTHWGAFLNLLVPGNQASCVGIGLSRFQYLDDATWRR